MELVNRFILILFSILVVFNVSRLLIGLTLANWHQLRHLNRQQRTLPRSLPTMSVIIPAYNEEKYIQRAVKSVLRQTGVQFEVIVVDDGSTDHTGILLDKMGQRYPQLVVLHQNNQGKSRAINHGLAKATGELVMVLDADSYLGEQALMTMSQHFVDPQVIGMSANVRITRPLNWIEWVQKIEYLLGYRLKGSEESLGLEYIIGGVGSTFRRQAMQKVGGYDTDSVTEDIDFTLKLITAFGNRGWRFGYANDVMAYTPPVQTFTELIRQRLRWKYGRFKALVKYRQLIFSTTGQYTKTLSWWKLPKVYGEELMMLLEPVLILWIIGIAIAYLDPTTIISILVLYTVFALATFIPEDLSPFERLQLLLVAPLTYFILYVINVVDWICLIRCLRKWRAIVRNQDQTARWEHVQR